ncbi:MAG TPA: CDP-alcohol phosphatidyltransferase family protein [Yinghuangia sp.]|uniref:CDP-alcohol phosphatidyltransferase family protein n=1 Tax=Yinghuangia sp. YIM S10712 TaxID=3436930 RepID=UPI002C86FEEC|nr:CDP-alcohol phosphatidyltransferase family protein [Yinghuangia sp.]
MEQPGGGHGPECRDEDLAQWADQHGGHRPEGSRVVLGWLALMRALAGATWMRSVPPNAVTMAALGMAVVAVVPAAAGGRWALAAAGLVLVAGVLDGLDGAVARRQGRAGPRGAVLDAMADRCTDVLLVMVLWLLGAWPRWCVAVVVLVLLHEYLRARANAAGMAGVGAITVAERPTRVVVVVVFAACQGVFADWPFGASGRWAVAAVVAWTSVSVVGLVHLGVAVRRGLPAAPGRG